MIHSMILLFIYQCFHHIHCLSASIAMNYMISGAKYRFRCHSWCRNTQNLLPHSISLPYEYYYHAPNLRYRIGYDSNIAFTITVSAPNLRIRIWIQILTDVKKWYPYPRWRRFRMRISANIPHLLTSRRKCHYNTVIKLIYSEQEI